MDREDSSGEVSRFGADQWGPSTVRGISISLGLIDSYRLTRECLVRTFAGADRGVTVLAFSSVRQCVERRERDMDLIVYCQHGRDKQAYDVGSAISAIRSVFEDIPLIVLSDSDDAHHPRSIRNTLKWGAHALISTRTTGVDVAVAAIRFVQAGGTFAPPDLQLSVPPDSIASQRDIVRRGCLTARQTAVLLHLQRGKANKTIAHELGMSESTVKVHVRNILRKMGATNRTQAAYNAQRIDEVDEAPGTADI